MKYGSNAHVLPAGADKYPLWLTCLKHLTLRHVFILHDYIMPISVSLISFVDDSTIEVVHATQSTQVSNSDCDFGEEYETDSDDTLFSDDEPDYVTNKPAITRSGRQVKAWAKFDV